MDPELESPTTKHADETTPLTPELEAPTHGGYDAQKEASRPKPLDGDPGPTTIDPVLTAAVKWAEDTQLAPTLVSQLQTAIGAPTTGIYDAATAAAVRTWQAGHKLAANGKANVVTCRALGLISHRAATRGSVDKPSWEAVKALHPQGVIVMGAVDYDENTSNNQEFLNQADEMAPAWHAVAVKDGKLVIDQWFKILEPGDVITQVQSVHETLLAAWHEHDAPAEGAAPPPVTLVKNLSLLSHG